MPRARSRRSRRQATFAAPRSHLVHYALAFLACCAIAAIVQLTSAP